MGSIAVFGSTQGWASSRGVGIAVEMAETMGDVPAVVQESVED